MAYTPANPNGQATMAASSPVVIASNQAAFPVTVTSTTVTGSVAVTGTFWQATQPVSGTVTANAGTGTMAVSGPLTDTQLRATPVPVSGTFFQATQPVSIATMPSTPVTGTFWQATQPVSGTVTVNTISGFATEATLAARIPANGQALMAASVPVTLASNQSALPVSGTFFQATQPVSLTSTTVTGSVAVTGTFWQATQPVSGPLTDAQLRAVAVPVSGTVAATGTFFQATQPVSGPATDAQMRATPLPVAGTRSNAGSTAAAGANHLTVGGSDGTNLRPMSTDTTGKLNVIGTFFQATQPVSGPLTDAQIRATPLPAVGTRLNSGATLAAGANHLTVGGSDGTNLRPMLTDTSGRLSVIGTFFQATQPVSLASTTITSNVAVADVTSTGTLAAAAQTVALSVIGGMSAATIQITGTWVGTVQFEGTVDGTNWVPINGVFAGGTAPGPTITTNGVIRVTPGGLASFRVNATAWTSGTATITMRAGQGTGGTFLNQSLPVGANVIGSVNATPPAITKGTQAANGVTTQDLHNAGRAFVNAATAIAGVTAVTAEALLTLNVSRDAATVAAVTTIAVTATKRLRITGLSVGLISTGATVLSGRFSLRVNPAGAAAATSPILVTIPVPSGAALAQAGGQATIMFPEAIELSGTMQCGITQVCSAITGTVWASLIAYEY